MLLLPLNASWPHEAFVFRSLDWIIEITCDFPRNRCFQLGSVSLLRQLFDWSWNIHPNTSSTISSQPQTAMNIHGDPSPTHADLRSLTHDSTRFAQQTQKYYRFRSGPMSRIGQSVLFTPEEPREGLSCLVYAPVLTHPDTVGVRTWTKRDHFEWRTWDIWPLDCPHKVGRRRRRCCNYVPPRWEMERSMKRRHKLISGDELDMEEDGIEDAARALSEERISYEDHVEKMEI
jgi:hypothetical protein